MNYRLDRLRSLEEDPSWCLLIVESALATLGANVTSTKVVVFMNTGLRIRVLLCSLATLMVGISFIAVVSGFRFLVDGRRFRFRVCIRFWWLVIFFSFIGISSIVTVIVIIRLGDAFFNESKYPPQSSEGGLAG